jgi:glyoxylase I family protein
VKVTRILHSSVNIGDDPTAADCLAFYRGVLGLADAGNRPDFGFAGAWLAAGDAQVHLIGGSTGDGAIRPTDHHTCFGVADLDGALAELAALGVESFTIGEGDARQVFFADPAGNTIELQVDHG